MDTCAVLAKSYILATPNTHPYANISIWLNDVNAVSQKTVISDNLGNQYPGNCVKFNLAGNSDLGKVPFVEIRVAFY